MKTKLNNRLKASALLLRGNGGFSLPELVIAIVILAIASGAILHSFLTSVNLTKKAIKLNEASDAAQNIQETIEAFSYKNFLSGNEDIIRYLGITEEDFENIAEDKTVVLKNLTSGDSTFDAKVKISTGSANVTNGVLDLSSADGFYLINNKEIASYSAQKATFQQTSLSNPDSIADSNFKQFVHDCYSITSKSRKITINILPDKTDDEGKITHFRVDGEFVYTFNYMKDVNKNSNSAPIIVSATPYTTKVTAHAQTITGSNSVPFSEDEDTTTVFFGYWPTYADNLVRKSNSYSEEFEVNNINDLPVRLILVKQKPSVLDADGKYQTIDDAMLNNCENKYIVEITESHSKEYVQQFFDDPSLPIPKTVLTNALLNISSVGGKIPKTTAQYTIRGSEAGHGGKAIPAEEIIDAGKLVNSQKEDRLLDITIEIYDQGEIQKESESEDYTAKPFASFSGNKLI